MRNEKDRERGLLSGHASMSQVWVVDHTHGRLQAHEVQVMWLQLLLRLPENSRCERQMAMRFL